LDLSTPNRCTVQGGRDRGPGDRAPAQRRGRFRLRAGAAGFTLIELMVVVVILGLLAGLVAPRYLGQGGKSNIEKAREHIESLGKALEQYRLDVGTYPNTDQGLQALEVRPDGIDRWQGPYVQRQVPPDPWGHSYHYKAPGEHADYDLYSYGADDKPGGKGENVDITSWDAAPAVKTQ
jgi:general secretion pathway protein G